MSGNSKSSAENIINACENKPNEEKWMEAKRCFQNLQEELKGLVKKYPTEAKKRKVPENFKTKSEAMMTENVNTVIEYLENVQKYKLKTAGEIEAAKREVLDMADCIYQLKQNDKEQRKGDKVSRIQVRPEVASSPGTGGQQKDIDETVSNNKKAKQVYDSDLSKTCVQKPTSQQKGNNFSQTVPSSPNPATVQSNIEKQKQGTASTEREKIADEKKNEKIPFKFEDIKNKYQSDNFGKTAGPHSKPGIHTKSTLLTKPENQLKDNTFSKTLPATQQMKFDMQKDGKQLDIAKGRKEKEEDKKNKKSADENKDEESQKKGKEKEEDKKNKKSADENKDEESQKKIHDLELKVKQMERAEKDSTEKADLAEKRCKELEGENEKLQSRSNSLEKDNSELNSWCQELQSRNDENENELHKLKQEYLVIEAQCENLRLRLNNSESRNADVESENKYLKEQVDELTMRLSSFASKQLSDGNPNVADLSDQNRPTKIGEKFGSLYDDEWSEAFDAITTPEKSEDDAIKYLINIIQESYNFCTKTAHEQLKKLNEKMKTLMTKFEYEDKEGQTHEINTSLDDKPNIDSARAKYAKDYRKAAACESLLGVKQMFKEKVLKEELDKLSGETKDSVIAYVDKCTELIWFMVVQDPPMVIEIPEPGKKFNANAFKPYKTKGKLVKLAVWPAVKLFENGGLISKGYALPE